MIVLIGAPGTGAQALCAALEARFGASEQRPRLDWSHTLDNVSLAAPRPPGETPTTWLLMGLDLPCPASDRPVQEAQDAALRAALSRAGASYRVVYGQGEQRVASALNAIKNIAIGAYLSSSSGDFYANAEDHPGRSAPSAPSARLRVWNCEKCSDPECEHRLFTALTGRNSQGA